MVGERLVHLPALLLVRRERGVCLDAQRPLLRRLGAGNRVLQMLPRLVELSAFGFQPPQRKRGQRAALGLGPGRKRAGVCLLRRVLLAQPFAGLSQKRGCDLRPGRIHLPAFEHGRGSACGPPFLRVHHRTGRPLQYLRREAPHGFRIQERCKQSRRLARLSALLEHGRELQLYLAFKYGWRLFGQRGAKVLLRLGLVASAQRRNAPPVEVLHASGGVREARHPLAQQLLGRPEVPRRLFRTPQYRNCTRVKRVGRVRGVGIARHEVFPVVARLVDLPAPHLAGAREEKRLRGHGVRRPVAGKAAVGHGRTPPVARLLQQPCETVYGAGRQLAFSVLRHAARVLYGHGIVRERDRALAAEAPCALRVLRRRVSVLREHLQDSGVVALR